MTKPLTGQRHIGHRPMHIRPKPGQYIKVLMRDGKIISCVATMVHVDDKSGIVIYHKGRAIDESKAAGWWPEQVKV